MGMAASQARLLSITSRIADNELRAQLVNNSKMRLATESSKVSDQYVSALNDATMMISNYDVNGNSQTQKLTYNALTSYSSHNNQYGLVNANGKLLVSENEAINFVDANGDVDRFLEAHGLEYTSTFFTENTFGAKNINLTGYNEYTGEDYDIGSYTLDELKAMYEGLDCGQDIHNTGSITNPDGSTTTQRHLGYDLSLQSFEYANFTDYFNQLEVTDMAYTAAVITAVKNDQDVNLSAVETHIRNVNNASDDTPIDNALAFLRERYTTLIANGKLTEGSEYATKLDSAINAYDTEHDIITQTISMEDDGSGNLCIGKREDGTYAFKWNTGNNTVSGSTTTITETIEGEKEDGSEDKDVAVTFTSSVSQETIPSSGDEMTYTETITYKDPKDNNEIEKKTEYKLSEFDATNKTVKVQFNADRDAAKSYVISLLQDYRLNITSAVNRDPYATSGEAQNAKKEYDAALDQLLDFIFGPNAEGADPYEGRPTASDGSGATIKGNEFMLFDPGWIISKFGDQTSEQFQIIEDIYVLDQLFNTYGEPAWGWIDKNNPSENAEAKVKWYTNLFERMQKGYTVIEDGLASSNEWIRFALEGGLVTMEQVDTNNNWVSMLHSNCSNITEVTDEKAVALAEAEYNRAMNNIENKDKRFDMELKNIDTEHNSLQTEYDSIKKVIDKNIERSFKMYQA